MPLGLSPGSFYVPLTVSCNFRTAPKTVENRAGQIEAWYILHCNSSCGVKKCKSWMHLMNASLRLAQSFPAVREHRLIFLPRPFCFFVVMVSSKLSFITIPDCLRPCRSACVSALPYYGPSLHHRERYCSDTSCWIHRRRLEVAQISEQRSRRITKLPERVGNTSQAATAQAQKSLATLHGNVKSYQGDELQHLENLVDILRETTDDLKALEGRCSSASTGVNRAGEMKIPRLRWRRRKAIISVL